MDCAMKSLSFLSPQSLARYISIEKPPESQQLVKASPSSGARPYRVSNWNRTLRKGIMAESLRDLLHKVGTALLVAGTITLVLDEDGTIVENEEFFQTLSEGTVFIALAKGHSWHPVKTPGYQLTLSQKPRGCHDVACVSLDLYKTNPEDFIGCLNFRATLYGTYSISYDMRCYGAKRLVKEALRCVLYSMRATGHVLLGASSYVQLFLDSTEVTGEQDNSQAFPTCFRPSSSRKMLQ